MIKLIITDCDGVLTTDKKFYTEGGKLMKQFSGRDTTAIRYLEKYHGVKVVVLSGDDRVNRKYCEMHRLEFFHSVHNKRDIMLTIISKEKAQYDQVAFIGDDLIDLQAGCHLQERGGLFLCPKDAVPDVLRRASMLPVKGGHGVIAQLYADRKILFEDKDK